MNDGYLKIMSNAEIRRRFTSQAYLESSKFNIPLKETPSYLAGVSFGLHCNFTLSDWKEVRKGDYWEVMDSLEGTNKIKFRIKRILEYLNQ